MSERLDAVITAHGGLDRWNTVRSVDVTFNWVTRCGTTSRRHSCSRGRASTSRSSTRVSKAGRRGALLEVTYQADIPAHTKTQKLYFADAFMLKRLDYVTDVLGGVAAHYCYDPVTVEGIVFPTLRRVVRRTPDGPLLSGRTSFVLDYTNVEVRT